MIWQNKNNILLMRGLSLVEILIASGILLFAFLFLMTTFQGAGTESTFTREHFTAMFIAQKVLEDINQRVTDNPHFFTELVGDAEGEPLSVVNGESKYFRLLENTTNFDSLLPNEDKPITDGELYDHLKQFTVQVSTKLQNPLSATHLDNLVQVEVIVRWPTKDGDQKEYRISQLLHGIHDDSFKVMPSANLSPAALERLDKGAVQALSEILCPKFPDLMNLPETSSYNQILRVSPGAVLEIVQAVGRMVFLVKLTDQINDKINEIIIPLEKERDLLANDIKNTNSKTTEYFAKCMRFTELQQEISAKYQEKAINMLKHILVIKDELPKIKKAFKDPTQLGNELSKHIPLFLSFLKTLNIAPDQARLYFSAAEKNMLSLVAPPFLNVLSPRKEPDILKKVLDIQKISIIMDEEESRANNHLRELHNNIANFRMKYLGHHPNYVEYLDQEKALCRDLTALRSNYAGIEKLFQFVRDLPDEIKRIEDAIPQKFK